MGNSNSRTVEIKKDLDRAKPILFNLILMKVIRMMKIRRYEGMILSETCISLLAYADE